MLSVFWVVMHVVSNRCLVVHTGNHGGDRLFCGTIFSPLGHRLFDHQVFTFQSLSRLSVTTLRNDNYHGNFYCSSIRVFCSYPYPRNKWFVGRFRPAHSHTVHKNKPRNELYWTKINNHHSSLNDTIYFYTQYIYLYL